MYILLLILVSCLLFHVAYEVILLFLLQSLENWFFSLLSTIEMKQDLYVLPGIQFLGYHLQSTLQFFYVMANDVVSSHYVIFKTKSLTIIRRWCLQLQNPCTKDGNNV